MQPRDVLALARALQVPPGDPMEEVVLRNVVGRAYYAAFLHAREYLRTKLGDSNLFTRSKGVHAAVDGHELTHGVAAPPSPLDHTPVSTTRTSSKRTLPARAATRRSSSLLRVPARATSTR